MPVTMTGAEFKSFYSDPSIWGAETFHDDTLIRVDGVDAIQSDIDLSDVSDTARIELECGEIMDGLPGVPQDMIEAVAWWRDRQENVQYVLTVPKAKMAAFEEALSGLGLESSFSLVK